MYRGFNCDKIQILNDYKVGKNINLLGFTSTTKDKKRAIGFALNSLNLEVDDPSKTPVLLVIEFTGNQQYFFLNSEELSAFKEEEEVLLQDGIQYTVKKVSIETMDF